MHSTFGTTENSVGEYPAAYGTYEMALDTMHEYLLPPIMIPTGCFDPPLFYGPFFRVVVPIS